MKYSDLARFFEEGVKERREIKNLENISGLAKQHATYFIKAFELVKSLMPKSITKTPKTDKKNYVIIIDEINRANISRVFGELITLIEPDKRSHGTIPLEARLPSGDPFIVPSNLFIIGTMNTADKSIALLDIALRRRFEFESMYPKYEIKNQEIYDVEILEKINKQIIKSKGHDFQIGHAYFMGDNKDLVQRMNKKVIPLLLEYYMNDEKEVKGILNSAGLIIEENSWPLKISGKND
jgi:5-methylcytosine-specific restriction endonuclease McrBC GTP-binding regulatory subunit McrB